MLIKLNEGEGLTIKANHSDESNSYVVSNINGKYLRMREFPSGDTPPKPHVASLKEIVAEMEEAASLQIQTGRVVSGNSLYRWARQLQHA